MIILDTNVVSALMRPKLNSTVVEWADRQPRTSLWTTSVSLMEIRIGLLLMPKGQRREMMTDSFSELLEGVFLDRVLPLDVNAAEHASGVHCTHRENGRNVGTGDVQIAGIALAHRATLATRNTRDFADLAIPLVNPWAS